MIEVKVVGASALGKKRAVGHLKSVSKQLYDMSAAFEQIGGFYRGQILAQFGAHGFVPGAFGAWTPLNIKTIENKKGLTTPLVQTGELLSSLTSPVEPYNINETKRTWARFGTSDPIGIFQQLGTHNNGHVHIPERPIILGNEMLDEFAVKAIGDHLFRWWV